MLNPIFDWSDEEVWEFIKQKKIDYNPLYDQGYKRVGCIGCPMAGHNKRRELEENPKIKERLKKANLKHFLQKEENGEFLIEEIAEEAEKHWQNWLALN